MTIEEEYREMVHAIGLGFHPDTAGGDYTSLPAGYTAERVEAILDRGWGEGLDLYAIALEEMNALALEQFEVEEEERRQRECGRIFDTPSSDPWRFTCDLPKGHTGDHSMTNPMGPDTPTFTWRR